MSILKKLGGAVKKTVKKVAKPVQKVTKNKLLDQIADKSALEGAQLDVLRGDFGNLGNRLQQGMAEGQLAARIQAGDPTAYLDAASMSGSQAGQFPFQTNRTQDVQDTYDANPYLKEPQLEIPKFLNDPLEIARQQLGIDSPQNLIEQVTQGPIYDEAGRILNKTANPVLQEQMEDVQNPAWYKRLGSWIGDKASKRYSDVKGILGSEAAKPYLGGLAQVGGGIASNLYADKAMRDYISAVNQGQDLDVRLQGPSAMEGLTGTEEFGRMQEFARGGMTPAEEAARQESLRRQNQAVMANNQAIAESAQRRGLRGGQQLAQQMLGAQEGANRLSQDEQNLRAQMFGRSERATGDVLSTRSNIARSQDAQRAADAEKMTQQALYRQQAKERSAQLGSQRKSGQGQIFASTGNVLGNIINPVKSAQPQNALGNFNQQHQETEEEKKRRSGQV